jgi:hypothetical protein
MDSQHIALWSCSFLYLHLRRIMNPPFHPPSVCPSVNLSSLHLPHTETHQWGPHPSSFFSEISALLGALISHWGTRFCILHIFPTFIHYLLYRRLYFPSFTFVITIRDLLSFWPHATPVTLGWSITSHFHPRRHRLHLQSTTQVTYLYPLILFTLSCLWHNLPLILASP